MPRVSAFAKLKSRASRFGTPNIRNYNRLEGNPRSADFDRAIAMETNDPMWFLCRQWQLGEFQGEDAGTAAEARVLGSNAAVEEITIGGERREFSTEFPLEAQVERESVSPTLWIRAQAGRQFAVLLKERSLKRYLRGFTEELPIEETVLEDDESGALLKMALGRYVPDGYKVIEHVRDGTWRDLVDRVVADANDSAAALAAGDDLYSWFFYLYYQPEDEASHWKPNRLEYQFELAARRPGSGVRSLKAREYHGGDLDWTDFEQEERPRRRNLRGFSEVDEQVQTFLPTPLRFGGMPHPRLWQLEDGSVNFGKLSASPTAIMNVLMAEYGLNYSNDWFVLPWEMSANTVSEIRGILVKDVFGKYEWVAPAIEDPETDWQTFAMFHQTEINNQSAGKSVYYLPPVIGDRLEGDYLELLNLMRDEVSNLVWGIEVVVEGANGSGRRVKRNVSSRDDFSPAGESAAVRYVLGNTVPENWTPFVAVAKGTTTAGGAQEIRLQRAKMPGAKGAIGRILTEEQPTYFIEEEEVPRSGVMVSRRFQRTRWKNGTTVLWVGRKKQAGGGEGNANLAFDALLPIA